MGILGLTHTPIFRPSDSRPFLSNKWFILQPVRLCAVNICTRPHAVIARKEKASALRIGGVEVLLHLERVTGMSREMQSDRSESKTKLVWIQRTKMNVASFLVVSVWGCIYCSPPPQSGWTTWIQGESQPNACLSIYSPASRFHPTKAFSVTPLRISLFLSIANFHTPSSSTLDFFYFTILLKYIFLWLLSCY